LRACPRFHGSQPLKATADPEMITLDTNFTRSTCSSLVTIHAILIMVFSVFTRSRFTQRDVGARITDLGF